MSERAGTARLWPGRRVPPADEPGGSPGAPQALDQLLSDVRDEERNNLGRWLHDDLGQLLVGAQLRLARLERGVAGDASVQPSLRQISDLVDEALVKSRSLIQELMAPLGSDPSVDVELELEELTARMAGMYGIACRFDSDSEPKPTSREVATALVRATQELLCNVVKHSEATTATVQVVRDGDSVRVTVSDDGIGFQRRRPQRACFGLAIVHERLDEVGGDVAKYPGRRSGARIVLTAPLSEGDPW